MKKSFLIIMLGISFCTFVLPRAAFAAFEIITTKTLPETPGPNQKVTVSINSFTTDLNSAEITWYVDKIIPSGKNRNRSHRYNDGNLFSAYGKNFSHNCMAKSLKNPVKSHFTFSCNPLVVRNKDCANTGGQISKNITDLQRRICCRLI